MTSECLTDEHDWHFMEKKTVIGSGGTRFYAVFVCANDGCGRTKEVDLECYNG